MRWTHAFVAAIVTLALGSCGRDPAAPEALPTFRVEVSGEQFLVRVVDDTQVAALEARMNQGITGVLLGTLAAGDGGFNAPWSWHLDPGTVQVADMAIEVCDGRPSMVEADLAYWIDTVGQFCPWGARVVARTQ